MMWCPRLGEGQFDGRFFFFRRQGGRASGARVILQTVRVVITPACEPCPDGVAVNLEDVGNLVERIPTVAQQYGLGTHPHEVVSKVVEIR